jgi:DNA-binding NarL/FixJ family response regulator
MTPIQALKGKALVMGGQSRAKDYLAPACVPRAIPRSRAQDCAQPANAGRHEPRRLWDLTPREARVANLAAADASYNKIATQLFIAWAPWVITFGRCSSGST